MVLVGLDVDVMVVVGTVVGTATVLVQPFASVTLRVALNAGMLIVFEVLIKIPFETRRHSRLYGATPPLALAVKTGVVAQFVLIVMSG